MTLDISAYNGRGSEVTGEELLELWEAYKASGGTMDELASALGLSFIAVRNRIYRTRGKRVKDRGESGGEKPPLSIPGPEARIAIDERANTLELESASSQIKTLDDLVEACKIDLEVWQIDRHVINKWGALGKTADGANVVVPLYQVKAWLSKRHPEPVEFVIQPVEIQLSAISLKPTANSSKPKGIRRALIIPDVHFGFKRDLRTGKLTPFHDRAALDVVLQAAGLGDWDEVVFLGDMMDFAEMSDKFLRSPEMYWTVQPAIVEAAWWLGKIRMAADGARIRLLQGNHDLRAETAVITHLISAYDLRPADELELPPALSVPRLLGLERLGIEWVDGYPDGEVWLNNGLRCIHGDMARGNPGDTTKALVQKSPGSVVMGHIHRIEMATRTEYKRGVMRTITALCPGTLCRVDGVVPGHKLSQNWQQGFGVAYYDEQEFASVQAVPVQGGLSVWDGRVLSGRERLDELRSDTGWEF